MGNGQQRCTEAQRIKDQRVRRSRRNRLWLFIHSRFPILHLPFDRKAVGVTQVGARDGTLWISQLRQYPREPLQACTCIVATDHDLHAVAQAQRPAAARIHFQTLHIQAGRREECA